MKRVLFVCHGNICRSPMAEFVMKDMVRARGLARDYEIASAATSTEEIGNPVHRGTRRILNDLGISTAGKVARQMTKADYAHYDLLVGMDGRNLQNMLRICGGDPEGKIIGMLPDRDIADPWYTGDFQATYDDVVEGCERLLR